MKHLMIPALMFAMTLTCSAQLLNVGAIEKINTPVKVDQAVISPDGQSAIVSTNTDLSLRQVSIADGTTVKVADGAIIDGLRYADDSQSIVFVRPTVNKKHLRYKSVASLDLNTRVEKQVAKPMRQFNGVAFAEGKVAAIKDGKVSSKGAAPVAYTYLGQLMLNKDGRTIALNPNGKEGRSYLWPSVSPDGTKVAYYLGATGAFVCDIDGSNVRPLGALRAPAWLDNNTIVGMHDLDNGQCITSSEIVACDLNGTRQVLTGSDVIALYPTASATGDKIGFSTPAGEFYIININR